MNTFTLGLIVVAYLLSLAYLGFLGYKKTTSASDYLLGGRQFYDCGEQQAVESRGGGHRLFFLNNNRRSYLSCRRIEQSILFEDGGCGSNGVCLRSVHNSIRWGLPSVPIFMGCTNPVRVTS